MVEAILVSIAIAGAYFVWAQIPAARMNYRRLEPINDTLENGQGEGEEGGALTELISRVSERVSGERGTVSRLARGSVDRKVLWDYYVNRMLEDEKRVFDSLSNYHRKKFVDVVTKIITRKQGDYEIADSRLAGSTPHEQTNAVDDQNEVFAYRRNDVTGGLSPLEYERHCAALFRLQGWDAQLTDHSGDQGVDIVARRRLRDGTQGKLVIVVQCKLYSKAVGNFAVQEVFAGTRLYSADLALVVAPNGFTAAAIELARVTGVELIHHDEISDFLQQVGIHYRV